VSEFTRDINKCLILYVLVVHPTIMNITGGGFPLAILKTKTVYSILTSLRTTVETAMRTKFWLIQEWTFWKQGR